MQWAYRSKRSVSTHRDRWTEKMNVTFMRKRVICLKRRVLLLMLIRSNKMFHRKTGTLPSEYKPMRYWRDEISRKRDIWKENTTKHSSSSYVSIDFNCSRNRILVRFIWLPCCGDSKRLFSFDLSFSLIMFCSLEWLVLIAWALSNEHVKRFFYPSGSLINMTCV